MKILGIHHVAFAHDPSSPVAATLNDVLGLSCGHIEHTPSFVERTLPIGSGFLQMLEPSGEGTVQRFVERKGNALHHIAFTVDDLDAALAEMRAAGVPLIDEVPRPGGMSTSIAFIHPSAFAGLLVELVDDKRQLKPISEQHDENASTVDKRFVPSGNTLIESTPDPASSPS